MACLRKANAGRLGLLLFCAAGALLPLEAQKIVSARAGLITYLQEPAFLDGKRVVLKTARYPQMRDGETLSTGRGWAELLLSPGVVLRLADRSQVRLDDGRLSDTRVTIQQGEALIEVVRLAEGAGMDAYEAGGLDNGIVVEGLTALIIVMNKRYKSNACGIRMTGVTK